MAKKKKKTFKWELLFADFLVFCLEGFIFGDKKISNIPKKNTNATEVSTSQHVLFFFFFRWIGLRFVQVGDWTFFVLHKLYYYVSPLAKINHAVIYILYKGHMV